MSEPTRCLDANDAPNILLLSLDLRKESTRWQQCFDQKRLFRSAYLLPKAGFRKSVNGTGTSTCEAGAKVLLMVEVIERKLELKPVS
jgi:hypothetical protein